MVVINILVIRILNFEILKGDWFAVEKTEVEHPLDFKLVEYFQKPNFDPRVIRFSTLTKLVERINPWIFEDVRSLEFIKSIILTNWCIVNCCAAMQYFEMCIFIIVFYIIEIRLKDSFQF